MLVFGCWTHFTVTKDIDAAASGNTRPPQYIQFSRHSRTKGWKVLTLLDALEKNNNNNQKKKKKKKKEWEAAHSSLYRPPLSVPLLFAVTLRAALDEFQMKSISLSQMHSRLIRSCNFWPELSTAISTWIYRGLFVSVKWQYSLFSPSLTHIHTLSSMDNPCIVAIHKWRL